MARIQALDFSVDLLKTLLWQYDSAPNLRGLLEQKQEWFGINHEQFWRDWYRDVFDLRTINDFGATVWAIILNIPLVREIGKSPDGYPNFGFDTEDAGVPNGSNFFNSNFGTNSASGVSLNLTQKRLLLLLRYYRLVNKGNILDINKFLAYAFKDYGVVYVADNLDMTINYVFGFEISSQLEYIFTRYDILPRPAGVKLNRVVFIPPVFGFEEYHRNFDRGTFAREV